MRFQFSAAAPLLGHGPLPLSASMHPPIGTIAITLGARMAPLMARWYNNIERPPQFVSSWPVAHDSYESPAQLDRHCCLKAGRDL